MNERYACMQGFPLSLNLFLWKHTHTQSYNLPICFPFPSHPFFQEPLIYYQFSPPLLWYPSGHYATVMFSSPFPKGEIHNIVQRVAFVPWALKDIIVKCSKSCVRKLKFILNSQHSIIIF